MDLLKSYKIKISLKLLYLIFILIFINLSCSKTTYKYKGEINPLNYQWLIGKKIFIDLDYSDKVKYKKNIFKFSKYSTNNNQKNIQIAITLKDILKKSGAKVLLSKLSGKSINLKNKLKIIKKFNPDIYIGIQQKKSYDKDMDRPVILISGNKYINPASYDLALDLRQQFGEIIDEAIKIILDKNIKIIPEENYNSFNKSILNRISQISPAIIGRSGFSNSYIHSIRLKDNQYIEKEVETYFLAIANYFKRGIPKAKILLSCKLNNNQYIENILSSNRPEIAIKILDDKNYISTMGSLQIKLDKISIPYKKISSNLYLIKYGEKLYPGNHIIEFSFRNIHNQSSPLYYMKFHVKVKNGDYKKLVTKGSNLLRKRFRFYKYYRKEGLKMLLSAYSINSQSHSLIKKLIWGFKKTKNFSSADYFSTILKNSNNKNFTLTVPIEYYGKIVNVKENNNIFHHVDHNLYDY